MVGEKFYISLSSLTSSELNACIRYSTHELVNKRKAITATLKLYKLDSDVFFSLLEDEKKLFSNIFGTKARFNKKALVDHFHYCLLFFEKFAIQISIEENKEFQLKTLELFYRKRGLKKESSIINSKLIDLTNSKNISFKSYLNLYELYIDRFNILVENFSNDVFENIEKAVDGLDKFYFIAKLHWTQELEVLSKTKNFNYEKRLLNEIQNEIAKDKVLSNKLLFKIYNITFSLYNGKFSKEEYLVLKDLILDNLSKFEILTKKQFLTDLSNYIAFLYSTSSDLELLKESFEINKIQTENKFVIENNRISDSKFSTTIRIALTLKEFDWVEKYIEEFSHFVENENLVVRYKAELYYNLKKYEEALVLINTISLKTFVEHYEIKTLYAKILLDKKEYDLLENHLNTFELYLRRNKEGSSEIIDRNLRFVLYLKRLNNNITDKNKIQKLKIDVTEDLIVFNRHWLLAVLENQL